MQTKDFASKETADKYLRGELSAQEAAEFEAWFIDKPEVVETLALDQLMIDGLRHKQKQSRKGMASVSTLFRTPARASLTTLAACTLAFGFTWYLAFPPVQTMGLANVQIVYIEPTRGNEPELVQVDLSAAQQQLVLSIQPQDYLAEEFEVVFRSIEQIGMEIDFPPARIRNGELTLSIPTATLSNGDYLLGVRPTSGSSDWQRITVRITDKG